MIFGKIFSLLICFLKSSEIQTPAGTSSASILKEVIMNELTVYSLCYKQFEFYLCKAALSYPYQI